MEKTSDIAKENLLAAIQEKGFWALADEGSNSGCACAWLTRDDLRIEVDCWKVAPPQMWANIVIEPRDEWDKSVLLAIGEKVRDEINRPDMDIRIIIGEEVFPAPVPDNGFDYFYDEHNKIRDRFQDFDDDDWEIYQFDKGHYHGVDASPDAQLEPPNPTSNISTPQK